MNKRRRPSGRYRETEVRALIENYAEVLEDRETYGAGLRAIVGVADLKRAWRFLARDDRRVLLLVGVMGATHRDAGVALEKSHAWVGKRYRKALEELTWLMNGGI
jgi:DNA-directed RNA polymerase specialized sigma24 family protein